MMNRREFMRDGAMALAALGVPRLWAEEDVEAALLDEIVVQFGAVNPIDPKTDKRKYISFGFITDEHYCKRVPGDDAKKPVKDYWYHFGDVLTNCEPSIRLLGAAAGKVGLDAIFNGGDFSTGNSLKSLTDAEYLDNVKAVKALFTQYVPAATPVFTVDGNHDRCYPPNKAHGTAGHSWTDAQWREALAAFNSDVSANRDVDLTMHRDLKHPTVGAKNPGTYAGNSYHVDCKRLTAGGGPNVRFVCVSEYDKTPGNGTLLRMYDGFQFFDPATKQPLEAGKTPENTLVCVISHGNLAGALEMAAGLYLNAGSRQGNSTQGAALKSNFGEHKGRGFVGAVAGHLHMSKVAPIDAKGKRFKASCVQVTNCYAGPSASGRAAYKFSLFTVNTDRNVLVETRVAGKAVENHETIIDVNT